MATNNPVFAISDERLTDKSVYDNENEIKTVDKTLTENRATEKIKRVSQDDNAKREKKRIMKNVILISMAFFLNFNSYTGLMRLQSSLHRDEGMGVLTSSLIHFSRIIACLLLPNIIIRFLGHKWAMALGLSGYSLWMAANGYAVWGTMVPASILVGACSSLLWTAQSSYLTISAGKYAKLSGELQTTVISRFFGIFFFSFQISGITGAIISSTILRQPKPNITEEALAYCGVNDCPDNDVSNPNEEKPDNTTVWILVGVYIGIALTAILLVSVLVDKLPRDISQTTTNSKKTSQLLAATLKQLKKRKQLALIPVTTHTGFSQAAFSAEFTKSYITCALGLWKVGLVIIAFSCANAAIALTSGRIVKYTGRIPICTAGFLADIAVQVILLTWMPSPDDEYLFYIIGVLWGIKEAILQTQINALYGSTFQHSTEAAYANYRMLESIGFAVAYAYSSFLCTSVKLYILTGSMVFAAIGYYSVEYWNHHGKDEHKDNDSLIITTNRF